MVVRRIDRDTVLAFLDALCPGEKVTFQAFRKRVREGPSRFRAAHFTDVPRSALDRLEEYNSDQLEIGFMVNRGDGKGRRNSNVQEVRALFLDLDGAPLEPVLKAVTPSAVVETSPGRFHVYFFLKTAPAMSSFPELQALLAERFGGDPAVSSISQVMRLPGTWNCKRKVPWLAQVVSRGDARFDVLELVDLLSLQPPTALQKSLESAAGKPIYQGSRNRELFEAAKGFAARGLDDVEVASRLSLINERRCRPHLAQHDVAGIATRACRMVRSEACVRVPLWAFDVCRKLGEAEHKVYVQAWALSAGGVKTFTMTHADIPCVCPRALLTSRRALVKKGLIEKVGEVPALVSTHKPAGLYRLKVPSR